MEYSELGGVMNKQNPDMDLTPLKYVTRANVKLLRISEWSFYSS